MNHTREAPMYPHQLERKPKVKSTVKNRHKKLQRSNSVVLHQNPPGCLYYLPNSYVIAGI